jgi:hypothetical protein
MFDGDKPMNTPINSIITTTKGQRIVLLYKDDTKETHWTDLWGDTLQDWMNSHPTFTVCRVFMAAADMIPQYTKLQFNTDIRSGPQVGDRFNKPNGEVVEFLGVNPSNRKYKYIIFNETLGKRFKVTPSYLSQLTKL